MQNNPWVEVNLMGAHIVRYIEIDNRPDGNCLERLGNFKVYVDGVEVGRFSWQQMQGQPPRLLVPINRVIHYIRVRIEGYNYLHLGGIRAIGN